MKHVALLIFVISLTGCATPQKQSVDANAHLENNEGIALVHFSCGKVLNMVSIYETGKGWNKYWGIRDRVAYLDCTNGYNSLSLPEGSYYISSLLGKAFLHIPEEEAFKFKIEAHKINYIGNINLATQYASEHKRGPTTVKNYSLTPHLTDKRSAAEEYFKSAKPSLSEQYSFTTNLAYK